MLHLLLNCLYWLKAKIHYNQLVLNRFCWLKVGVHPADFHLEFSVVNLSKPIIVFCAAFTVELSLLVKGQTPL